MLLTCVPCMPFALRKIANWIAFEAQKYCPYNQKSGLKPLYKGTRKDAGQEWGKTLYSNSLSSSHSLQRARGTGNLFLRLTRRSQSRKDQSTSWDIIKTLL